MKICRKTVATMFFCACFLNVGPVLDLSDNRTVISLEPVNEAYGFYGGRGRPDHYEITISDSDGYITDNGFCLYEYTQTYVGTQCLLGLEPCASSFGLASVEIGPIDCYTL